MYHIALSVGSIFADLDCRLVVGFAFRCYVDDPLENENYALCLSGSFLLCASFLLEANKNCGAIMAVNSDSIGLIEQEVRLKTHIIRSGSISYPHMPESRTGRKPVNKVKIGNTNSRSED